MSKPSDLVQGTLDLLILKIIALEPRHAWAIGQRLKQVSGDVLQVSDGSLYPALHKLEQEGDGELRYQVERLTEEHLARGMSPAEARLAARRAMAGIEQRKEECRDTRRVRFIEDAVQDLRYAGRTLVQSPGFAAAAILT